MKKLITILAVLAVMTASVPASALSAAAADTAPAAAEEAVDPAIAALAGVWEYQESPEGGEYDYQQKAAVTVSTEGTFVYEPLTSSIVKIRDTVMFSDADGNDKPVTADNGTRTGTITIEYEEYPDGTKSPFFRFTTDDGAPLFDCIADDQDENMLWIGNGGMMRMVRVEENIGPAITTADFEGNWLYQTSATGEDDDFDTTAKVTIYEDGSYVFEDTATGKVITGTTVIGYEEFDDFSVPLLLFINEDGSDHFGAYIDSDDYLHIGNGGLIRMVRDDEEPCEDFQLADFIGNWFYMVSETGEDGTFSQAARVQIDPDGTYTYTAVDGTAVTGTVSLGSEKIDIWTAQLLIFTQDDGREQFTCYIDTDYHLHIGNGGLIELIRADEDTEPEFGISDFEGSWVYMVSSTGEDGTFYPQARIQIDGDGAYTYINADGSPVTGTVSLGKEEIDIYTEPLLIFTQDDGREQFTCYIDADYHLHIGNSSLIEVVRDDDTEEYDLDDFKGNWLFQFSETGEDDDFATTAEIRIAEDEGNTYVYTDAATGAVTVGTVDLTYVIEAGTVCPMLRFTKQDGSVQMDCYIDDIDTLHNGNGGLDRIIRAEEAEYGIDDFAGDWLCQIVATDEGDGFVTAAKVTIGEDGSYTYTDSTTGEIITGTAEVSFMEDGFDRTPILVFIADGNEHMIYNIEDANNVHAGIKRMVREDVTDVFVPKYTDDEFSKMSVIDYESKTGDKAASADVAHNADGTVSVVLKDAAGKTLDTYTLDAQTGKGTQTSDGAAVDLPQTGITSAGSLLTALAALLMTAFGALAVRASGIIRRRKDSE